MNYLVPALLIALFVYASCKKVNVYNSFVSGAKGALPTVLSITPYLLAIFVMVNMLRQSGLSEYIGRILSVPFGWLGIPQELIELVVLRPFSGSGSIALLTDIFKTYGVDSYISRCASVIVGSSETVFYVLAVYFAGTKVKKFGLALPIALFCNIVGCIAACLLCRLF